MGFPFDFDGTRLTGAWNNGLNVQVQGYLGLSKIYDRTVIVDTFAPTWFDFSFDGVNKLVFSSSGGVHNQNLSQGSGEHFVMDNFTFHEHEEPVIPEKPRRLCFSVAWRSRQPRSCSGATRIAASSIENPTGG